MKNHAKIIELLEQYYQQTNDKKQTVLLGSSAYVLFTRKLLYTELINRTSAFKDIKTFNYFFANLVKKGLISVNKKGRRNSDGSKTYYISEAGIAQLNQDYFNFIQVLVDDCSEEIETCDICDAPESVPTNDVETQKIQSTESLSVPEKIENTCDYLKKTLLFKNLQYGNSSLAPIGVFDLPKVSKIQARLEDKISRLSSVSRSGDTEALKDTLLDLAGYSILYLIVLEEE
jgi:DNA-binding PadR family transcriptional regulator